MSLDLLGHVDEGLVVVEPKVVVGHAHLVEGDFLGVFEETIRTPEILEPADVEIAVLFGHVLRQSKSMVPPTLGQEDVGHISLILIILLTKIVNGTRKLGRVINEVPWIPR